MSHSPLLNIAIEAARAAEEVIRHYFQGSLRVELKSDRSPVTQADLEAEQAIKAVLQRAYPDHGFFGEETGRQEGETGYTWLVDPIDGTKSFIRELPFFSTQIALLKDNRFVLGVSNAPEFGELAHGERGAGAFLNDRPLRVSDLSEPDRASLSLGNIHTLAAGPGWAGLGRLVGSVNRTRGYGDFYHYHRLAAGQLDLVVESDLNILDVAALSVIIQEAGGRITELSGAPLGLESTSVLASNGHLHDQALALLGRS